MLKKYIVATIVLTGVFVAGVLNVYHQSQMPQMSDTALANIEALAGDDTQGGEGGGSKQYCAISYIQSNASKTILCSDCSVVDGVGMQYSEVVCSFE